MHTRRRTSKRETDRQRQMKKERQREACRERQRDRDKHTEEDMRQRQRERQTHRDRERYTQQQIHRDREIEDRETEKHIERNKVGSPLIVFQAFFQNDIVWMTCSGPLHKRANFMAITAMAESHFPRKAIFLLISVQR